MTMSTTKLDPKVAAAKDRVKNAAELLSKANEQLQDALLHDALADDRSYTKLMQREKQARHTLHIHRIGRARKNASVTVHQRKIAQAQEGIAKLNLTITAAENHLTAIRAEIQRYRETLLAAAAAGKA